MYRKCAISLVPHMVRHAGPTFPSTVGADTLHLLDHTRTNRSELHLHALSITATALLNTLLVPAHTVRAGRQDGGSRLRGMI